MTTSLTRVYRFSASHRLHAASLSNAENSALYGKCNNPFGHGHDYVLEITCGGGQVRIGALDRLVNEAVLSNFAYSNINTDVPEFQQLVPTTENIVGVIADRLSTVWHRLGGGVNLIRVHVQETARNSFEITL